MPIDLHEIDTEIATLQSRIRKLEMIRQLAGDPEALQVLKKVFAEGRNGHGSAVSESHQETPAAMKQRGRQRGPLSLLVEQIMNETTKPLTTRMIVDEMTAREFEFSTDAPTIPVNDALWALQKKGLVKVSEKRGIENYWVREEPQK